MSVTYLVMKNFDRLTVKQAEAVLKALSTVDVEEVLWDQEKPNLKIAIEKLEEAVERATENSRIRSARRAAIAKAKEED